MNSRDPFDLRRKTAFTLAELPAWGGKSFPLAPGPQVSRAGGDANPAPARASPADEMSFAPPNNVPSFTNPQRRLEDVRWASSGSIHGRHSGGKRIGGLFEKPELPMYKDKPYGYGASSRRRQLWKRKRTSIAAGTLIILALLYWLGIFSAPVVPGGAQPGWSIWDWVRGRSSRGVNWEERRERVKEAFMSSWDAYERYAWGFDEFHPVSKTGRQMVPNGLGWIIVDSLDTLMIMNLTSRLTHAREWVSTSLNYDQDHEVNTFETTIRMLGGLLSAHYLSSTFPNMAPLLDDDKGEDLYLEKATDLADRLLGAFNSESGVPYASVNLKTMKGVPSHVDGGASSTAEAASLQLEFKFLAKLTGEKNYWDKAEKVIQVIDDNGRPDGLVPIFIYAHSGGFRGENIRLGSRGDSYYEYLIKQYLQTSKQEPVYLDMWDQALAGIRKHLITYSKSSNITVLGELPDGMHEPLSPKMDHLVCFMPGTIALGATGGIPEAEARSSRGWSKKQDQDMTLARELMKTCWGMYKVTATGLAPEIAHFNLHDPPLKVADKINATEDFDKAEDADWRTDYVIKPQDSHNLQRPETVESLFYMWRITGDDMYRRWGWEMFEAFMAHTAVEDGGGYSSINNVNKIPTSKRDNMESFWLAETLKYFYLLFSPRDLLPLDQIIINTEAHIFPRFGLGQLFSTGWTRKPRDSAGHLLTEAPKSTAPKPPTVEVKTVTVSNT